MNKYQNTKVLILGLGLNQGGLGAARFFAKHGAILKVTDLKTVEQLKPSLEELKSFENIEYILGEHRFEDIDWADLIIRNQGIKPDNKYLKYALEQGKRVEMDIGIVLEYINPSQIIGVTGTKGKSTTASLIFQALQSSLRGGTTKQSIKDRRADARDDTPCQIATAFVLAMTAVCFGHFTGSSPPFDQGVQRQILLIPSQLPFITPYLSIAS